MLAVHSLVGFLALTSCAAKLAWKDTKFLVAFGDSYSADGFNISAGVDSPVPASTWSNGPNWVQALGSTYNVNDTKVFNLASGGATIDSALVTPYLPTVLSIVDQVSQFNKFLAPKPAGAEWSSNNTLFAVWIGINDVGRSFSWTNISQPQFYRVLMNRLDTQLEELYQAGARSFLFLTVPPVERAPVFLQQGHTVVEKLHSSISIYNNELRVTAEMFQGRHQDLQTVIVFDTQPLFNTLLDNSKTFGFVNSTGWCDAYQDGTPSQTTQVPPCAPVSSYFWLDSLHPLFTVHNALALSISTTLST